MNLGGIDAHWWWLLVAALLGILELLIPGILLMWMAGAAALTGLAVLALGLSFPASLIVFALFSIAAVLIGKRQYARNPVHSSDPMLNDRTARLIGESVTVVDPITDGLGRVRVGDSVWTARGPDAPAGTRLRVTGCQGTDLIVAPDPSAQFRSD